MCIHEITETQNRVLSYSKNSFQVLRYGNNWNSLQARFTPKLCITVSGAENTVTSNDNKNFHRKCISCPFWFRSSPRKRRKTSWNQPHHNRCGKEKENNNHRSGFKPNERRNYEIHEEGWKTRWKESGYTWTSRQNKLQQNPEWTHQCCQIAQTKRVWAGMVTWKPRQMLKMMNETYDTNNFEK